jgi:hypothetical protein
MKVALNAASDVALDVAWYAALDAAGRAVLGDAWDNSWDAVRGAVRGAALYAALNAAWYVAWEVIRDIEGYENNPFEYIVKIYGMGLYPRGFMKVNGVEIFSVDFPLELGGRRLLGCWRGDKKGILYAHEWTEDCIYARPISCLYHQ